MFGLKKKTETKIAKAYTLPEVVQKYVSQNNDLLDDNFSNINAQIEKNKKIIEFIEKEKKECFSNEQHVYDDKIDNIKLQNNKLISQKYIITKQVEARAAGYKKIDLSFLSMKTRPLNSEGSELSHYPAFSVHKYKKTDQKNEFVNCEIEIGSYYLEINYNNFVSSCVVVENLLKSLLKHVKKENFSVGWGKSLRYSCHKNNGLTKRTIKITSHFKGIIPTATKQKIEEATKIFTGNESCGIFLVKECPDWETQIVTEDPLIIGVIGDQAYLIDNFDCTNLETYVKTEFTG